MAHQAGTYPGYCSMKRLGVFLLPPGWDASPSQGYPTALSSPVLIYPPGWREALYIDRDARKAAFTMVCIFENNEFAMLIASEKIVSSQ